MKHAACGAGGVRVVVLTGVLGAVGWGVETAAAQATVHEIPAVHPSYGAFVPAAVSGDGRTVIGGARNGPEGTIGVLWTASRGFEEAPAELLPDVHNFTAVSADGAVVVGYTRRGDRAVIFRWTRGGGVEVLENEFDTARMSEANGISRAGDVVVGGVAFDGVAGHSAGLWTPEGGVRSVSPLPDRTVIALHGVSDDGRTAVGRTARGAPMLWREEVGTIELRSAEGSRAGTRAFLTGVGDVVLGSASDLETSNVRPILWKDGHEPRLLDPAWSVPTATAGVNLDGRVVVLNTHDGGRPATLRAAVWTPGVGIEFLAAYARRFGAIVTDTDLERVIDVSDDGRSFLGAPRGGAYWLIELPPADPADFNLDGVVDDRDIEMFIACYDGASLVSPTAADVNRDGITDFFDLIQFMDNF